MWIYFFVVAHLMDSNHRVVVKGAWIVYLGSCCVCQLLGVVVGLHFAFFSKLMLVVGVDLGWTDARFREDRERSVRGRIELT